MSVEISTLENGLRVVSEERPNLETVAIGIWVDVGARDETSDINGVSHLLEHMAFKGTARRSARDIAEEIENVGGQLNAYTSREHTAYFAHVLKEDGRLALDILADILQNSAFEESELERERAVVIQEIGLSLDTPDDLIFDFLQETAFPDQPLGRTILGPAAQVAAYGADTLRGYMADHYTAPRMVLAAAGRISHQALADMAGEMFAGLPSRSGRDHQKGRYGGGEKRQVKDLEQAHVTLGFEGVSFDHPDFYALQIASAVLGGGMSSRLFQEVREKRGLAYSIYAFAASYADSGLFGIYGGTSAQDSGELVTVAAEETARLAGDAREDEVARARAQIKAGLLMSLESTGGRCEQLAKHMLIRGRVMTTEELIEKVEAVDAAAVRRVLGRVLTGGPVTLAALGPVSRIDPYDRIAARFQ